VRPLAGASAVSKRNERDWSWRRKAVASALLVLGISMGMAALNQARAQGEKELPGITVEGGAKSSGAKKKAAKAPAPTAQPKPVASTAPSAADAPYSTPASVSFAGSGEINTFGVEDVLRSMPGVSTVNSPNNPGIAVNIRGFEGSGRVNMSIDGVRQNFRFTGHDAQGFAYIDPLLLAGIDIQRGAVSTAGGAGALAGSADLRTLDVDDILKPGRDYGSLSSVTWGSNGVGFSEMASGAIRSGAISIAGAISKHDQDDYQNGNGQRVPFTDEDLISGLGKVHIQIDPDQRLSFGTVLYDNDFAANGYNQNVRSQIYTASYAYNPANDLIDFKANFYGSDLTMQYLSRAAGANPAFYTAAGRQIEDTGLGFDVANVSRFDLGGIGIRSQYGYEYFHDDVDSFNKLDPDQKGGVNPSGQSSIGGAFSETTFSKSIFDFIVGLRYDTYNLNGSNVVLAPEPVDFGGGFIVTPVLPPFLTVGPYTVDKSESAFSPKLTLVAKLFEWLEPYVTYSKSFRAPTVQETLAGGVHPGADGINFVPNPFLDPERQKGWELGFNSRVNGLFQRGDAFRFKADYYTMDVENYISACFDTFGVEFWFCNAPGTSKVDGVELQGSYDVGYAFAGVSYSYNHTTLPSQVNGFGLASFLPENVTTLTGGVRLLDEKLTIGARGYITSKSSIGDINKLIYQLPTAFADGYTTVDLFSSYKATDDITVSLTVTNLMDVAYTPALTSGGISTPTNPLPTETGRGRTFLLTTRAQF
jgi:hemoglobin/transferrin/lactoferrin receptor protein